MGFASSDDPADMDLSAPYFMARTRREVEEYAASEYFEYGWSTVEAGGGVAAPALPDGWGSPGRPDVKERVALWVWCPVVWAVLSDDPCEHDKAHDPDCECQSMFPLTVDPAAFGDGGAPSGG